MQKAERTKRIAHFWSSRLQICRQRHRWYFVQWSERGRALWRHAHVRLYLGHSRADKLQSKRTFPPPRVRIAAVGLNSFQLSRLWLFHVKHAPFTSRKTHLLNLLFRRLRAKSTNANCFTWNNQGKCKKSFTWNNARGQNKRKAERKRRSIPIVFAKNSTQQGTSSQKEVAKSGRTICKEITDWMKGRLEAKMCTRRHQAQQHTLGVNIIKAILHKKIATSNTTQQNAPSAQHKTSCNWNVKELSKVCRRFALERKRSKNANQSQVSSIANNATEKIRRAKVNIVYFWANPKDEHFGALFFFSAQNGHIIGRKILEDYTKIPRERLYEPENITKIFSCSCLILQIHNACNKRFSAKQNNERQIAMTDILSLKNLSKKSLRLSRRSPTNRENLNGK